MENFFNSDCHLHTNYSYCGSPEMTVERIANLMKKKGIRCIAITDHSSHFYLERNANRMKACRNSG
ncbi:PHP domain-containing protein [Candidatus Aerophobetes bacterium]|nr:PHP domain-containing protein [Candidatus Aerophobetes bacterium]